MKTSRIARKPFSPALFLASPNDNLISAACISYLGLPFVTHVQNLSGPRLRPGDPALKVGAKSQQSSLRIADVCRDGAAVLASAKATFTPSDRQRLRNIAKALATLPDAPRPAVTAGSIAMALEELVLEGAFDKPSAARLTGLVARVTDLANALFQAERYTGFLADIVTTGFLHPSIVLSGLVRLGHIALDDPRLRLSPKSLQRFTRRPDVVSGDLRSVLFDLLFDEKPAKALANDVASPPYKAECLKAMKEQIIHDIDGLDHLQGATGQKVLRNLSRYQEGIAMNLSHQGLPELAEDCFSAAYYLLSLCADFENRAFGQRRGADAPPYYNLASPEFVFLRDCRTAEPFAQP